MGKGEPIRAHLLQGSPKLEGSLDFDQLACSCKALELVRQHLLPARWESLAMVICQGGKKTRMQ